MNIVIIKHFGDNCPYIFSVPDDVHLKENDMVLVQTRRGEQQGKCVCDSFTVDESPLKALITKFGAKEPLAPVIGRLHLERWNLEDDHA